MKCAVCEEDSDVEHSTYIVANGMCKKCFRICKVMVKDKVPSGVMLEAIGLLRRYQSDNSS